MSVDAVRTPPTRRLKMFSKTDFMTGRYAAKVSAIFPQYSLAQNSSECMPSSLVLHELWGMRKTTDSAYGRLASKVEVLQQQL